MSAGSLRRLVLPALVIGLGVVGSARPQTQGTGEQRPRAVAETRLLMQGINKPNFEGLERLLQKEPADTDAWTFARGQALLVAENGNLLMLRPPRGQGRDVWMDRATALRESATRVARAAANRDYEGARTALAELGSSCNHCHQSFRVAVRVSPMDQEPDDPKPPRSPTPVP